METFQLDFVREYCIQIGRIGLPFLSHENLACSSKCKKILCHKKWPRFSPGPTVKNLPGAIFSFPWFRRLQNNKSNNFIFIPLATNRRSKWCPHRRDLGSNKFEQGNPGNTILHQVSIPPLFYDQLFHAKIFTCRFSTFSKNIGRKAVLTDSMIRAVLRSLGALGKTKIWGPFKQI